jgi:tetratricopeptide (TPR) repeat protein
MPTTLIASAAVALNVGTMSSGSSPFVRSAYSNVGEWLRANDFGAGLLRQGDTRLAKLAFGEVQRVAPGQIEGWRNMALAFIEDMSDSSVRLDDAQVLLSKCDLISPGDLTTAWIRGKLFAELLKYSEAEDAFRAITVRYPRDRQVWKALGSVLFKDLRIDESLDAYERALEIDPEDAEAHEGKWFVLRALGRLAEAEGERRQFERFGSDSSVRPMRAAFLRTHPEYSREADSMHWHEVRAVSTPVAIDPASK